MFSLLVRNIGVPQTKHIPLTMKIIRSIVLTLSIILTTQLYSQEEVATDTKFSAGFLVGYNGGVGGNLNVTAHKPIDALPVSFRFGIGYTNLEPGNSADARRIFINNATNGVPEEKGKAFDYRLDVLVPIGLIDNADSYLVFGPRYSSFRGNFKYVGGNEDFDVTTRQFGAGIGVESHFKMNEKLDLVVQAGVGYFFNTTLKGHDTQYSPDNDNVNPRDDNENDNIQFTYKDADKAINDPDFVPRVMIGLNYKL